MSKMVCKYCKDEFCVNDQCPMYADYCPVPDTPGVCKHENRVDIKQKMRVRECVHEALVQCGIVEKQERRGDVYLALRKILAENGWAISPTTEHNNKAEQYLPGQVVHLHDIEKSANWKLVSVATDPFNTSCTYASKDDKYMVRFPHDAVVATIQFKYCYGQSIHIGVVGESPYWMRAGYNNDTTAYKSADDTMFVVFKRGSDWGVIRRSTEDFSN